MASNSEQILLSLSFPFIFQYNNISLKLTQSLNTVHVLGPGNLLTRTESCPYRSYGWHGSDMLFRPDLCCFSSYPIGKIFSEISTVVFHTSAAQLVLTLKNQTSVLSPSAVRCSVLLTALCADGAFLLTDHYHLLIL